MKASKSWREKLEKENPSHGKIVKILIPKPLDVEALIRKIPTGKLATLGQIMDKLARDANADKSCAKVTGIFLRIIAEAAEEDIEHGEEIITPYWRVIRNDGSLNEKFPGGVEKQALRLKAEGHNIELGKGKPKVVDFEDRLHLFE
ncbi:MAG: hypothetical protein DRN12_02545 [Thermoplasmata archaeon]|nr:MAG: hypothetical protein DRN12_02545 [Thermoplasmata archaeon]